MMKSSQQILAEKMRLESQWNISYLENGRITPDMNIVQEKIKNCRRQLIKLDQEEAGFEYKSLDSIEDTLSVAT